MRAVIQRVSRGSVTVNSEVVASIERGMCVLVGVELGDAEADGRWLAQKIATARLFRDEQERMNRNVLEVGGELLAVSQFTLMGDLRSGRRPDFGQAMPGAAAKPLFDAFCEACRALGVSVATGVFGAYMQVDIVNDGPVTLLLDSQKRF